IGKIPDHFTFFLPWAGMEKTQYAAESHADVAAAERMAKLFDELIKQNPETTESIQGRHSLNTFFTRILFCFFAEDTGIFQEGQFTIAIESLTQPDGSDLKDFLEDLFSALDTEDDAGKPQYLSAFPYVNGRLFTSKSHLTVPVFNKKARDILVESGKLQWSRINPDIFGSMFQAVVTPDQRADLGQHYTSVPNILKTIEPLFLDHLKDEFDAGYDKDKKLEALLERIGQIKVFDPACGSGNFLVIAYKELRKLEHAILERLTEISPKHQLLYAESCINIENFFGIELDDFAAEVAILSLWIAKHQMNQEFKEKFRIDLPLIPLKETGQIRQGNSTQVNWEDICPNNKAEEIYLIGNPPYAGYAMQSAEQKADYRNVFEGNNYPKTLDYVALWFLLGADYIQGTQAALSFVSTNSLVQGEQVGLLFPMVWGKGLEIGYAHTSFKWENNARNAAGVTVVVINLRNASSKQKYIFTDDVRIEASNINGYLADGPNYTLRNRSNPISPLLPAMLFGSKPTDGGGLILEKEEYVKLIDTHPEAAEFTRRYMGSSDLIKGVERYCLWLSAENHQRACAIPEIRRRTELVAAFRENSSKAATQVQAATPWQFGEPRYSNKNSAIVPSVSSERRNYIPIGYVDANTVISNAAFAVYDAEPWVFALLTSRMHMVWVRAVAGRLETRYRYSNTIVYNNFPVPKLTDAKKTQLADSAFKVLDAREYHAELTLASLYDPSQMPGNLQLAHEELDEQVDALYTKTGFANDAARLKTLFKTYSSMIDQELTA
ncbi:class I SAM-dependent DNA methyltransferase, partial [Pontimonas sp.]